MKPHKNPKCGVCAVNPFERNNYFYGKQFTVRDLLQEQSYFNEKRYLINRMVHGWGVVCGLDVYWDKQKRKLVVGPGMALDCCGHEIIVCKDQYLSFDEQDDDCCFDEEPPRPGKFVLCLEHHECNAEPIELPAVGCDEKSKTEYNRTQEGFKLLLKSWEDACAKQPPKEVSCPSDYKHPATGKKEPLKCDTETVHDYLCRKLRNCPECEACDCVILATITIEEMPSGPRPYKGEPPYTQKESDYGQQGEKPKEPPYTQKESDYGQQGEKPKEPPYTQKQDDYAAQGQRPGNPPYTQKQSDYGQQGEPKDPIVDPCTNRKLVYNNQLLYDLIYCQHGDLPHIVDFSWRTKTYPISQLITASDDSSSPTREMAFDVFLDMIRDNELTVYFDQKMERHSLNAHTFMVCYLYRETGTGAYMRKQIPTEEIRSEPEGPCFTATFVARPDWIKDELDSPNSELLADTRYESGVDIEIILRGSRIWSEAGKGLDGEYLADKLPTGNGTQGGDFIDWFRVTPPDRKKETGKPYAI